MVIAVNSIPTSNEQSIDFEVNQDLIPPGTGLSFSDREAAAGHPLANALFHVKGVASVWILGNTVRVTIGERVRWGSVKSRLIEVIQTQLNS